MKYAILIYENEARWAAMTPEQFGPAMAEYMAYGQGMIDAGVMRGGEELHPTHMATTVRVRGGKVQTTDGPFAETKEQLGGFYLVETESLDEALAWAAKCPGASSGCVEVRPVVNHAT
ncbi:MAG: YciI family protein [Gemmatimonadaceae bacterium]|jgi:hypothetical protein|nr:YciI family protein [Gemmatimonadaceae bacterium]